jgi:hypothetical protein
MINDFSRPFTLVPSETKHPLARSLVGQQVHFTRVQRKVLFTTWTLRTWDLSGIRTEMNHSHNTVSELPAQKVILVIFEKLPSPSPSPSPSPCPCPFHVHRHVYFLCSCTRTLCNVHTGICIFSCMYMYIVYMSFLCMCIYICIFIQVFYFMFIFIFILHQHEYEYEDGHVHEHGYGQDTEHVTKSSDTYHYKQNTLTSFD